MADKEIKITNKYVPYSTMVEMALFVVNNSYGKLDGKYHEYLQDYSKALAILVGLTDYDVSGKTETELFDEVMEIQHSEFWHNTLIPEIHDFYEDFSKYIDSEIRVAMRPLANLDGTMFALKGLIDKVMEIVNAVNLEELKKLNLDELVEALGGLYGTKEDVNKNTEKEDNIVNINSIEHN